MVLICLFVVHSRAIEPDSVNRISREMRIDSMLQKASSYLGVQYCRGGVNRECFDCSGFVQRVFAQYGYELPHSSAAMASYGKAVKKKQDLIPGDLILFKGRNVNNKRIGHVGIVVQNDGYSIIFIHASVNRGICFEELETSAYYKASYMGGRRIITN
ncbi:MAG: C40 family peptidase [Bacteroidota bacterium]|nr:C40 family peptidase [Bacteroidota bacterium]MDX5431397.1 C40 family peptidase [Bacteroidota bacterium]MDX5470125.1 C40 family peptidase [Bacteroidota bacterium]